MIRFIAVFRCFIGSVNEDIVAIWCRHFKLTLQIVFELLYPKYNRRIRAAGNSDLEQRVRYAQTQRARGVPLDTINALRIFSFPALPSVGQEKECMNASCIIAAGYNCMMQIAQCFIINNMI